MSKRLEIDKATLVKLYIKQGFSAHQIARQFNCWNTTILSHLKIYNIPVRNPKLPLCPDKSTLFDFYINQKLSPYSIAPLLKCEASTVRNWLFKYKIPVRQKNLINISSKQLKHLYHDRRLSLSQIGEELGCSPPGILKFFRKYEIPTRSTSESSKYFLKRKNFNGNKNLIAYMIGFRLGDLHIRKAHEIIRVGGGTTKLNQIELFKNLFGPYGVVYVGNQDKRGAWHPEVSLNKSFNFLLPKHERIPLSICKQESSFLNFLAGYTDAEGNIGCYPRGRFKITSYDYGILKDTGLCLKKFFGISPVYFLEKTKRINHNKDALSLILNNRKDLYKILTLLKPLLRHKKRRRDLLYTLKNVKTRLKLSNV